MALESKWGNAILLILFGHNRGMAAVWGKAWREQQESGRAEWWLCMDITDWRERTINIPTWKARDSNPDIWLLEVENKFFIVLCHQWMYLCSYLLRTCGMGEKFFFFFFGYTPDNPGIRVIASGFLNCIEMFKNVFKSNMWYCQDQ